MPNVNELLNILQIIVLAGIGYGLVRGARTQQANQAGDRAIAAQGAEIEALEASNTRLEATAARLGKEMREARETCAADVARLEGTVDQLRNENAELRSLVRLDVVPPALQKAMETVATANIEVYRDLLEQRLHPIEQGIARLLTERGST